MNHEAREKEKPAKANRCFALLMVAVILATIIIKTYPISFGTARPIGRSRLFRVCYYEREEGSAERRRSNGRTKPTNLAASERTYLAPTGRLASDYPVYEASLRLSMRAVA